MKDLDVKGFEEFKEKALIAMEKDIKKIIKLYNNLPKTEYAVLKELVKINPVKDVLHTVWISAFCTGIKEARIEFDKQKEKK